MAYITLDYYKTDYLGIDPADDTELLRYIARATDYIDLLTDQNIVVEDLTEAELNAVKKATAGIVEYYVENGDVLNNSGAGSESIGAWSSSVGWKTISKIALQWLKTAGLIDRSCKVSGRIYDTDQ